MAERPIKDIDKAREICHEYYPPNSSETQFLCHSVVVRKFVPWRKSFLPQLIQKAPSLLPSVQSPHPNYTRPELCAIFLDENLVNPLDIKARTAINTDKYIEFMLWYDVHSAVSDLTSKIIWASIYEHGVTPDDYVRELTDRYQRLCGNELPLERSIDIFLNLSRATELTDDLVIDRTGITLVNHFAKRAHQQPNQPIITLPTIPLFRDVGVALAWKSYRLLYPLTQ